jgi:uncharacterized membrane protein (UPF0127 family)
VSLWLGGLTLLVTLVAARATAQDQCPRWRAAFAGMGERALSIASGSGAAVTVRVRVADTPEQHSAGFQCATVEEIERSLILFDFGREILTRFHMQNVVAPLDIAFAKADGRIFAVLRMEPSPTVLYGPLGPFRYALETRAGFFASQGIRPGEARLVTTP